MLHGNTMRQILYAEKRSRHNTQENNASLLFGPWALEKSQINSLGGSSILKTLVQEKECLPLPRETQRQNQF